MGRNGWQWLLLLDPVTVSATVIGTFTAAVAHGITPFSGLATTISIPSKHYFKKIGRAFRIDCGLFYSDSFGHWLSRMSWESLQTGVGNTYSQTRNILGKIDRVDYYGGATFCTNEYSDKKNGVTLGYYININIYQNVDANFDTFLQSSYNGLYMHEYGHTIQGRHYGLLYLFSIGLPSLFDAKNNSSKHRYSWFERQANRFSKRYFGPDIWTNNIDSYYPTYK